MIESTLHLKNSPLYGSQNQKERKKKGQRQTSLKKEPPYLEIVYEALSLTVPNQLDSTCDDQPRSAMTELKVLFPRPRRRTQIS